MRTIVIVVALLLTGSGADAPWEAKTDLAKALKGYKKYNYNVNGSFEWKERHKSLRVKDRSKKKKHKHSGIGCSTFVSVVLTRIRYGDDWLKHFDVDLYQKNGTGIAKAFSLGKPVATALAKNLLPANNAGLPNGLSKNKVYMFDVLVKDKKKGWIGNHVGFVTVKNGSLRQAQYSGRKIDGKPHGGFHTGDFLSWLAWSRFAKMTSRVVFYEVPQPAKS